MLGGLKMSEITFTFDESRPWRSRAGAPLSIYVYGYATIGYDRNGAWRVEAISISTDGGYEKIGKTDPLFRVLSAAMRANFAPEIEEQIADDMRERGEWRDWRREERLSARQLGLTTAGLFVNLFCVGWITAIALGLMS
jgi:hypothetical protein